MFYPDINKFKELSNQGNLIPVYKEILADFETPLSLLKKIQSNGNSKNIFLMESVERNEKIGRFSFIGSNPRAIIKIKNGNVEIIENNKTTLIESPEDPFSELKKFMDRYNRFHYLNCRDSAAVQWDISVTAWLLILKIYLRKTRMTLCLTTLILWLPIQ